MNIIAFDTSADILCAALIINIESAPPLRRSLEMSVDDGLRHAELLTEVLETLCRQAGIERQAIQGIVCGKGPGSFTGLRIGMATAKGMAAALDCPVCSVSALDAMAWRQRHWPGPVLALLDARKNRFYSAMYYQGERLGDYVDLAAANFQAMIESAWRMEFMDHPVLVTGPDAPLLIHRLQEIGTTEGAPTAHQLVLDPMARKGWGLELAELGWRAIHTGIIDAVDAGPEYVRSSDAELGIILKNP